MKPALILCSTDCARPTFRLWLALTVPLVPLLLAGCAAVPYAITAAQTAAVNKAADYLETSETKPDRPVDNSQATAEEERPYQLVAEKHYEEALPQLRDRADRGETRAQEQLGLLYLAGLGVPEDPWKAFEWMRKAADGGRASAQYTLARFYLDGIGVKGDDGKAVQWAQRSMNGSYAEGTVLLATLYRTGRGVPQDYNRALELYRQADLAGSKTAPAHLAALYKQGQGVPQDYRQAIDWYSKAAERGWVDGWLQLAALYATCPDGQIVDGRRAVSYALKATEKKPKDYTGWAVLAAAYARSGDFPRAMETAGKSDTLLAEDSRLDAPAKQAAQNAAQTRLAALQEQRPLSTAELALPEE